MTIHIHQDDLPSHLDFGDVVAIDTETMGLNPLRDRLCLVQLSSGDGEAHLVKINSPMKPCPNLTGLLENTNVTKLFHFARFDISSLSHNITPVKGPIYCTKIASKLARTYTDRHGLRDLCRELLQIDISKQQQSSDWGAETLSTEQAEYAAGDVFIFIKFGRSLMECSCVKPVLTLQLSALPFYQHRRSLILPVLLAWIFFITDALSLGTK